VSSLRRRVALSDSPAARLARGLYRSITGFSVPAPAILVRPLLAAFLAFRACYYFLARVFVCEPLFKAYCASYGRRLRTGVFIHWITGSGRIEIGDDVLVDGKCSFAFAARYSERPELRIGSHTILSHGCSITVGRLVTIGDDCLIASGVQIFDAPGHPLDPELRKARKPANLADVRPVQVRNNVWIGRNSVIFPGVTIGEGSVVTIGSMVMNDVPPYAIVAGNPARVIGYAPGREPAAPPAAAQAAAAPASRPAAVNLVGEVIDVLSSSIGTAVRPHEDFYDAGVTSIMALPLLIELEKRFGVTIAPAEFSEARTAVDLAACIDRARG